MFGLDPSEILQDMLPTVYKFVRVHYAAEIMVELMARGPQSPANLDEHSIDTFCRTALRLSERLLELGDIPKPPEAEGSSLRIEHD